MKINDFKKFQILAEKYIFAIKSYYQEKIKKRIPSKYIEHFENISIIIFAYLISSLIIRPEFQFLTILKELFAIICCYTAVIFWFVDKISKTNRYRFAMIVITFIAPIFFITNPFSVATTILIFIICLNFLFFECLRVKNLFSTVTPVYVICEDEYDQNVLNSLEKKFKVMEVIYLNQEKSSLKNLDDMHAWLKKINKFLFYIFPRYLIYLAKKKNPDTLLKLTDIAKEFSIAVLKVNNNKILPLSFSDIDSFTPNAQEKSMISSIVKNKKIWIIYDGRNFVLELIKSISMISSTDVIVFCENEKTSSILELNSDKNRNFKIKIADNNVICSQDSSPDILFYSLPVISSKINDISFKDVSIKNIVETNNIIKFAQKCRARYVFLLSSSYYSHEWIKATSIEAEHLAQLADSQHRKNYTKFIPIRIPNHILDQFGIIDQMKANLKGIQNKIFASKVFLKKDVMPLLIKCIYMSIKDNLFNSNANTYTLNPETYDLNKVIKYLQFIFQSNEVDFNISDEEIVKLENFPSIEEDIIETSEPGVTFFKLKNLQIDSYKEALNIEQINSMSVRELVSDVFERILHSQKTPEELQESTSLTND